MEFNGYLRRGPGGNRSSRAVCVALLPISNPFCRSSSFPHSAVYRRLAGDGAVFGCLRSDAAFCRLVGTDCMGMVRLDDRTGNHARASLGSYHIAAVLQEANLAL